MFFRTRDGSWRRLDRVSCVKPLDDEQVQLVFEGGETLKMGIDQWLEALSTHGRTTIVSQPSTYALSWSFNDEGEFWYAREPVIGWLIDSNGTARPIVASGFDSADAASSTFLLPDGQVQDFDTLWDTIEEWVQDKKNAARHDPPRKGPPTLTVV